MKFDKDKLYLPYNGFDGELEDCDGDWSDNWSHDQRVFAAQACNNYHALIDALKDMIDVYGDEARPSIDKAKELLKELCE